MKIMNFALAFAASLLIFTSCSNEADEIVDVNKDVKVKKVFGVGIQTSESRTAIVGTPGTDVDHLSVHWTQDDKLSVFAQGHEGEQGDKFSWASWQGNDSHKFANFEGSTHQIESGQSYFVLYPAQDNARLLSVNGEPRLRFNIPDIQHAVQNSFDPAADIQVGKSASIGTSTQSINLLNACAFFYITLQPGYSQVDLTVQENEKWHLAGTVTAEVASGGALIKDFESDCKNEISLINTEAGGTYFIAFIPTSGFKDKLTLTLHKMNQGGVMSLNFEKANGGLTFTVGNYYYLGSY